jgi:hypothetical protein
LGTGDSNHGDSQNPYAFADFDRAPEAESKPTPVPKALAKGISYQVTDLDLAPRCPHCAKELVSGDAVLCLNCGYNLRTRTFEKTKVVYQITSADRTAWLMPGFLCVAAVVLIVVFDLWFCFGLHKFWAAWEDPDGVNLPPSFSRGLRAWVVFMTCFAIFYAARFAYRRLVLNPNPPEVEKKQHAKGLVKTTPSAAKP